MGMVRLTSGALLGAQPAESGETPASLDREALLVYSGEFQSMDGPVSITDEMIDSIVSNHNARLESLQKLANGAEVPIRQLPPIQLDHSTSARDTVGRLVGPISVGEHVSEDGESKKAILGKVRILGKENVEKVLDGRWAQLSIGADLEQFKLSELTITPFPAAAEATLLSRTKKGTPMKLSERIKAQLEKIGLMKKHLSEKKDEEAEKELSALEGEMKKMEADMGEAPAEAPKPESKEEMKARHLKEKEEMKCRHEEEAKNGKLEELKAKHLESQQALDAKHLEELKKHGFAEEAPKEESEEEKKEKAAAMAKMAATKDALTRLAGLRDSARLSENKADILSRLGKVRMAAKITPAEMKKIDVSKLAKENKATIDAVLKSYEDREPVIFTGLVGSAKATDISKMSKEMRMARLEAEMRENMPLKKAELEAKKKRLAESGEAEKEVNIHIDAVPGGEHDVEMTAICGLMDEGKLPEAKERMKRLVESLTKRMAGSEPVMEEKHLDELSSEFKKMHKQLDELVTLAGTVTG